MIYSKDDPVVLDAIEYFKIKNYIEASRKYSRLNYNELFKLITQLFNIFDNRQDCLDYLELSVDSVNVLEYKGRDDSYMNWYMGVHKDGLRVMRERKALEDAIKLDCDKALEEVLERRL